MDKYRVKQFIEFCADKVVKERFPHSTNLYNSETDQTIYTKDAQQYFDLIYKEIKIEFDKLNTVDIITENKIIKAIQENNKYWGAKDEKYIKKYCGLFPIMIQMVNNRGYKINEALKILTNRK